MVLGLNYFVNIYLGYLDPWPLSGCGDLIIRPMKYRLLALITAIEQRIQFLEVYWLNLELMMGQHCLHYFHVCGEDKLRGLTSYGDQYYHNEKSVFLMSLCIDMNTLSDRISFQHQGIHANGGLNHPQIEALP